MSVGNVAELPMQLAASSRDVIIDDTDRVGGAALVFLWSNWCGILAPEQVVMHVTLAVDQGSLSIPVVGSSGGTTETKFPPCVDPSSQSSVMAKGGFGGRYPAADLQPCRVEDLTLSYGAYAEFAADSVWDEPRRVGELWVGRSAEPDCLLTEWSDVDIRDGAGNKLDIEIEPTMDSARNGQALRVSSLGSAYEPINWTNWCAGPRPGPLHVYLELPNDQGTVDWDVRGSADEQGNLLAPPCVNARAPSKIKLTKNF
jgi:hypothetical protein